MTPEILCRSILKSESETVSAEFSLAQLSEILYSKSQDLWSSVFDAARVVHRSQFGNRLSFFAPLYFSSYCVNECVYCGFRVSNKDLFRKTLSQEEFLIEAKHLWDAGHRTMVLIAGEDPKHTSAQHIARYLETLRAHQLDFFVILEVGPLEVDEYRELVRLGVKQCLLFQETYERGIYKALHRGPKHDFDWRIQALDRATEAGVERVGFGVLLGLHDWREDLLSLIDHSRRYHARFGRYPSSISLPRLRTAHGVSWNSPELEVSDEDYKKMIAVLRLALPETGIILTTRETSQFREEILRGAYGISHVSAGCSTVPGGYAVNPEQPDGQFYLSDHRSLADVVVSVEAMGYRALKRSDEVEG